MQTTAVPAEGICIADGVRSELKAQRKELRRECFRSRSNVQLQPEEPSFGGPGTAPLEQAARAATGSLYAQAGAAVESADPGQARGNRTSALPSEMPLPRIARDERRAWTWHRDSRCISTLPGMGNQAIAAGCGSLHVVTERSHSKLVEPCLRVEAYISSSLGTSLRTG